MEIRWKPNLFVETRLLSSCLPLRPLAFAVFLEVSATNPEGRVSQSTVDGVLLAPDSLQVVHRGLVDLGQENKVFTHIRFINLKYINHSDFFFFFYRSCLYGLQNYYSFKVLICSISSILVNLSKYVIYLFFKINSLIFVPIVTIVLCVLNFQNSQNGSIIQIYFIKKLNR